MIYKEFQVGETTYKLRLSAKSCIEIEKKLGKPILSVLLSMAPSGATSGSDINPAKMSLPLLEDIVTILHGALQKFQDGVTLDKAYGIYDDYIDAGGSYMDFFAILQSLLEVSGFLPKAAQKAAAEEMEPESLKA